MAARLSQIITVGESMTHILEPVASEVLQYVIGKLGYADRFKDNIELISDFRTTSKSTDSDGNVKIVADRVRAKLTPNVNPTANKWEGNGTTIDLGNGNTLITNSAGATQVKTPWKGQNFTDSKIAVFYDEDNCIDLTELSVGSTLAMEVTMTFKNVVIANECISRIFQCFTNGENIGYVDLQYDYPVPIPIINTLVYLYSLRGPRAEGDSALKWIEDLSEGNITTMINRNKPDVKELIVNRNHFQALFHLDCSQEAAQPATPDGATVTFNLTVQYARANRMILRYPIIVNNQYVDVKYVPMLPEWRQGENPSPIMWQNNAVTEYWRSLYAKYGPQAVKYPWWDPWILPNNCRMELRGYKPVVSIAFTLDDPENPEGVTTIDLKDGLPGMELSEEILETIAVQKNLVLGTTGQVHVTVFADDFPVEERLLDLSDGRNLKVKKRLLNSTCRLVVGTRPPKTNGRREVNAVWIVQIFPKKG